MAQIKHPQLLAHTRPLAPLYFVIGSEVLLLEESLDLIKKAAAEQNFENKKRFFLQKKFPWHELMDSTQGMGLFAERTFIHASLDEVKTIDKGFQEQLIACIDKPNDDTVILLSLTRKPDKKLLGSALVKTVERLGVVVPIYDLPAHSFTPWLINRLKSHGLYADDDALAILKDKTEGNLLAAAQEIDKLKIFVGEDNQHITADIMREATTDSSRYSVFDLADNMLMGKSERALKIIDNMQDEGVAPMSILWSLSREISKLAKIRELMDNGQPFGRAAQSAGVWQKQQSLVENALRSLRTSQISLALRQITAADHSIKGMRSDNVWTIFKNIVLLVSRRSAISGATQMEHLKQL